MYIVKLYNGNRTLTIHGQKTKLSKASIVKGVNSIDSFSFTLLPSDEAFDEVYDYRTLVSVYNTKRNRYEFLGRVLCVNPSMESDGMISKDVVCESYFGFLHDSVQDYVVEQNWTVTGLLSHIISTHNAQVEDFKRFEIGNVTVTDPNDNLYIGIQREDSWDTINEKLIKKLGGEIRLRVENGVNYIDYLSRIGSVRSTAIEVSKNMISLTRDNDPSAIVTRLIPLGAKLSEDTEERLTIESVNEGVKYIESEDAVNAYTIKYAYQTWDDVTNPATLLSRGRDWLVENNKIKVKYNVRALELSELGLDIDDFEVCDSYPLKNVLLGVDDVARIIKKTINVCDRTQSTIELGDNLKTLTEIQNEIPSNVKDQLEEVRKELESLDKGVQESENEIRQQIIDQATSITETTEAIILSALESYVQTGIYDEFKQTIETQLSVMADEILLQFTTTNETINNVNGVFSSEFEKLYEYISINQEDGSMTFGSGQNAMTLTLDNDIISFKKNGVQFGWWDGVDFHTGNIVVEVNERAQFGQFAFVPRSDGSLMFLKVGDS